MAARRSALCLLGALAAGAGAIEGVAFEGVAEKAPPADRVYVQRLLKVAPNAVYPEACNSTVTFNDPGSWAGGNASMTAAILRLGCAGASRQAHWHPEADEWGYVVSGEVLAYVASPDGLPWPASNNRLGRDGVWYFPRNWLHGFACIAPEGCEVVLVFNTRLSVPIDNHNLDSTLAQAPDGVAAAALAMTEAEYRSKVRPLFAVSAKPNAVTSPLITFQKGICDPACPEVAETYAMPAGTNVRRNGQLVLKPGGVKAYDMRTPQFPFAKKLSQQLLEMPPGSLRGANWVTNANAIVVVTGGSVEMQMQGGTSDATVHEAFTEVLRKGDVFYVPVGRTYWLREATGNATALVTVTFDVGDWRTVELEQGIRLLPAWVVSSNLRGAPLPANDQVNDMLRPIALSNEKGETDLAPPEERSFPEPSALPVLAILMAAMAMPAGLWHSRRWLLQTPRGGDADSGETARRAALLAA